MEHYGPDLFKDTAGYYSKFRPLYPSTLTRYLVHKFRMDGKGRMLDLGCGTGQLALRFTDWFEEIVGVDTEQEMLNEAARLSEINRINNVQWMQGKAEELNTSWGSFRLITIAKAFHWMDRKAVIDVLYNSVCDHGGIAIIDPYNQNPKQEAWQLKTNEVVKRWLGDDRRAGNSTYSHPIEKHEDIIAQSSFVRMETHKLPSYLHTWTVDSIVGNLYSTSFASKRFFGDESVRFEDELRQALFEVNPEGVFQEELSLSVILAFKA